MTHWLHALVSERPPNPFYGDTERVPRGSTRQVTPNREPHRVIATEASSGWLGQCEWEILRRLLVANCESRYEIKELEPSVGKTEGEAITGANLLSWTESSDTLRV